MRIGVILICVKTYSNCNYNNQLDHDRAISHHNNLNHLSFAKNELHDEKRAFAFSISLASIWMNSSFAELVSKTTASDSTLNMPLVYNMMATSTPHQTVESFTASAAETVSP